MSAQPTTDPEYRPNPKRCIYLNGEINQGSLDKHTPHIVRLTSESTLPITVYIDSLGGSTYAADILYRLLKAKDQDGNSCKLITVCTGVAASAAADFLSSGDYALVYPHARVLYHGTRQVPNQALTTEVAAGMADDLKQTNEGFALTLATRSADRFVFRFLSIRDAGDDLDSIKDLASALSEKLSPSAFTIPERALERHHRNSTLTDFVFRQPEFAGLRTTEPPEATPSKKERLADMEAKILSAILRFEAQRNPQEEWSFDRASLAQIQEDFVLLRDYGYSLHGERHRNLAVRWGSFFLDDEQRLEFEQVSMETRAEWLRQKTENKLHPLWYFFVSVCRALQQGENFLNAEDAYWLGLVDEVIGYSERKFPSYRAIIEYRESDADGESANKKSAPIAD